MPDIKHFEFPTIDANGAPDASFLNKLIDLGLPRPINQSAILCGLVHRSANGKFGNSENEQGNISVEFLGALTSMGKAVITLFCIDSCCDSLKYRSRGEVSNAADRFKQAIIPAVAKFIGLSDAMICGPGVTVQEKSSFGFIAERLSQLIGAISLGHGLGATRKLLGHFLNLRAESTGTNLKDCKTLLQEYSQSRKMQFPEYKVLELAGPDDSPVFKIRVATKDGRSAVGQGSSKRRASQAAAENYLATHLPSVRSASISKPTVLGKRTPKPFNRYPVKDAAFLHQLTKDFLLPPEAENDVALALIHRSYDLDDTYDVGLGKDFGYLAILGSAVQNWATQDLTIRCCFDGSVDTSRLLLAAVLSDVGQDTSIAELFDILNLEQGLLVGSAQRGKINLSIRSDAVQALIAVKFRNKAHNCEIGDDLFRTRTGCLDSWITERIQNALQKDRDALLSPKTVLQEKCQKIGLLVKYDSEVKNITHEQLTIVPRIRIFQGESQLIHGQFPAMAKHARREGEELLARTILDIFDNACGIRSKEHLRFEEGQRTFALFFLKQVLAFISADAAELARNSRWLRSIMEGVLGTQFLKAGATKHFENWVAQSESLLGYSLVTESVLEFYRFAGRTLGQSHSDLDVIKALNELSIKTIAQLDALTYSDDIRRSDLFEQITELAVNFKLKATSKLNIRLDQALDDIALISRGRYRNLNIDFPSSAQVTVSARPGVLPAFVTLIAKFIAGVPALSTTTDVSIKWMGTQLYLCIHSDVDSSTSLALRKLFDASMVYQFLKKDIPAQEINVSDGTVELLLFGEDDKGGFSNAHKLEVAFHEGQPIAPEIYALLASWLHDTKNDLVAFQAAVQNSRKANSKTDKYRHITMASKHIEAAEDYLKSIALIIGADNSAQLSNIDLKDFFRDIVSDILSWLPSTVAMIPPSNTDEAKFVSDPRILRTVLINLCKNAVEAIVGTGRLTLEWVFDPGSKLLEIEVTDSCEFAGT